MPLRFTYTSGSSLADIDFVTMDGSPHNAAGAGAQTFTREFWRFTKATQKLEMPNGWVLTYGHTIANVGGFLTEVRDPFDNVMTLTWDAGTPYLRQIVQDLGAGQTRTVTINGWADDTATSLVYGSRTWTYEWAVGGTPLRLDGVLLPGSRWQYWYGSDGNGGTKMTVLRLPNGGSIHYTWGVEAFSSAPTSRVVLKERMTTGSAPYGVWEFDWSNDGENLDVTTPVSKVSYATASVGGLGVGTSRSTKTLAGQVLETETMTYDLVDNPVAPSPAPKTLTIVRDGVTYTTTFSYSSSNYGDYGNPNVIQQVGSLTKTVVLSYKHDFAKYIRGRVLTTSTSISGLSGTVDTGTTYDGNTGFVTGLLASTILTTYTPHANGNTATATDARGNTTSYGYSWGLRSSITTPMHSTTKVINSRGIVTSESRSGLTIAYTYDDANRVTSVTSNGGQTPLGISYTYGDGYWTGTVTTRGGQTLTSVFDGFGNTSYTVDHLGVQQHVLYDALGRRTYQSYPYGGAVTETGVNYTYDALGRPRSISQADGSLTEYEYSNATGGYQVRLDERVTSGLSRSTFQYWAGFGSPTAARLTGLRDAAGVTWQYAYDVAGRLTSVSAPGSPTRTWEYNSKNLLWKEHIPETIGDTVFTYDAVGNLSSRTDASGTTIQYQYDANNRLTLINSPVDADDVVIAYDAFDRPLLQANGTGRTDFAYDTAGRLVARQDIIAGQVFGQGFQYDAMDNVLIHSSYPSGRRVLYSYDGNGRLSSLKTQVGSEPEKTLASGFVYRGSGQLAAYQFGNGLTRSLTFDARQRPTHWTNGPLDVTYEYDFVGNVRSVTDSRSGYSSSYDYDLLDRLTTVSGYNATSYTYDVTGNRLSSGTVGYQYDATSRLTQLTGGATGTFTYDANGSLLSDPSGATYTYTSLNMAKTTQLGGNTTSYRYGPSGTRAVKVAPNGTEQYFVPGPGGIVAEYQRVGLALTPVREYVYLGGELLATITPDPVTLPAMTVSITSPQNGQTFASGQWVTLAAFTSVPPGSTIARVEFYQGGLKVGQATAAPFQVQWNNLPLAPGPYTFIARIVLTTGQAVSSAPITITVN